MKNEKRYLSVSRAWHSCKIHRGSFSWLDGWLDGWLSRGRLDGRQMLCICLCGVMERDLGATGEGFHCSGREKMHYTA